MPATLIGSDPSMPHKKHPKRPPSKDQFHGVIENLHFRIADTFTDSLARLTPIWRRSSHSSVFENVAETCSIPGWQVTHQVTRIACTAVISKRDGRSDELMIQKTPRSLPVTTRITRTQPNDLPCISRPVGGSGGCVG
jgi:hypothetical protein